MTRTELLQTINNRINANGSKSITGTILRDVLLNIVDRSYYEADGDDLRSLYGDPNLQQLSIEGIDNSGSTVMIYAYTVIYNMGDNLLLEPVKLLARQTSPMSGNSSTVILPLVSITNSKQINSHLYVFSTVSNLFVDLLACQFTMYLD